MPNRELLLKIADKIERQPETYNQGEWCGTACCVAGHALLESGYTYRIGEYVRPDGTLLRLHFSEEAGPLLGLNPIQARELFRADFKPPEGMPAYLRKLAETQE